MIAPDRLALGIEPNSSLSVLDMMKCAQLAEKKGFAATWVAEGRGGEVFALLSALAAGTSRMRLGDFVGIRAEPLDRRRGCCDGRRSLRRPLHAGPWCRPQECDRRPLRACL